MIFLHNEINNMVANTSKTIQQECCLAPIRGRNEMVNLPSQEETKITSEHRQKEVGSLEQLFVCNLAGMSKGHDQPSLELSFHPALETKVGQF